MKKLTTLVLLLLLVAVAQAQDPLFTAANSYLKAFATAKSWDDVLPHLSQESRLAVSELAPDDRQRVFGLYQGLQKAVAGVGEMDLKDKKVDGDRATVVLQVKKATANDEFQGQTVRLVREGGAWKVDIAKAIEELGS